MLNNVIDISHHNTVTSFQEVKANGIVSVFHKATQGKTIVNAKYHAAAFIGKLDPLKDTTMLLRLEAIIFILIGYVFRRFPTRQTEREEKIKNARTALKTIPPTTKQKTRAETLKTVLGILDS